MKKRIFEFLLIITVLFSALAAPVSAAEPGGSPILYIIGDSVTATRSADSFPMQGWGTYIADVLNGVTVENCAKTDVNAESFYTDEWHEVLSQLKANDIVMVAFGAPSVVDGKDKTYYADWLTKFADDAKAKSAEVIFVTPAAVGGSIAANDKLTALTEGVKSMTAKGCAVADLNARMRALFKGNGNVETDENVSSVFDAIFLSDSRFEYFSQIKSISAAAKAAKNSGDIMHLSDTGAKFAANLVAKELYTKANPLKAYAKDVTDPKQRTVHYDRVPEMDVGNVKGIFFDGMEYNGLPTQVFAYVGVPQNIAAGTTVPAMVLVHGGAGHAYDDWVQLWNDKGYAAISFDWRHNGGKYENTLPDKTPLSYSRALAASSTSFTDRTPATENQHPYHVFSDISLSYNLLNNLSEVENGKIGLTGISWGGIFTSRGIGEDTRFKFAMPVYGCGYLSLGQGNITDDSHWDGKYKFADTVAAGIPIFWINSTNDQYFSLEATSACALNTKSDVLIIEGLTHGQGNGSGKNGRINELFAYADSILKGGTPLPKLGKITLSGRDVSFSCEAAAGLSSMRLMYNTTGIVYGNGTGVQATTAWTEVPLDAKTGTVEFTLPTDAKGFYVEVKDTKGYRMTTEYLEAGAAPSAPGSPGDSGDEFVNGTIPNQYSYVPGDSGFELTVKGNNTGERISVIVLTPEYTDWINGNSDKSYAFTDLIKYAYGVTASSGVQYKYPVVFTSDDTSGKYLVRIVVADASGEHNTEFEYPFASPERISDCISAFNQATGAAIYTAIEAYSDILSTPLLDSADTVSKPDIGKWFDYYKNSSPMTTLTQVENLLLKSILTDAIARKDTEDISAFQRRNPAVFNEVTGGSSYLDEFVSLFGKYSGTVSTADVFADFMAEIKVLSQLKGVNTAKAAEIIGNNADILGVDSNKLYGVALLEICKEMSFDNVSGYYSVLADAIHSKAYEIYSLSQQGGGASSVGGGGGGSGASYSPAGSTYVPVTPAVNESTYFSDIADYSWAADAINALYKKGVLNGVGDGRFAPERTVTREEFVKLAVNALNITSTTDDNLPFEDCNISEWYYPYVKAAYDNSIIKGISQDAFGVGCGVRREDMCVIVRNALRGRKTAEGVQYKEFADEGDISSYALDSVIFAVERGIILGYTDNTFRPGQTLTRAEAAVIIYRIMSLL